MKSRSTIPVAAWVAMGLCGLSGLVCSLVWFARPVAPRSLDFCLTLTIPCSLVGMVLGCRHRKIAFARLAVTIGSVQLILSLGALPILWKHSHPRTIVGRPAADVVSDQSRIVQIPQATIELAAVSLDWYGSMNPSWWRDNGVSVGKRHWTVVNDYLPQLPEGKLPRRFAIRIQGHRDPAHLLAFHFDGQPGVFRQFSIHSGDSSRGEWFALARIFDQSQSTASVHLLVASGPFEGADPHATMPDEQMAIDGKFSDGRFSISRLAPKGTQPVFHVSVEESQTQHFEYRLRARDRLNHWHTARMSQDNEKKVDRRFEFDMVDADKLTVLAFERRLAHWVEFTDVSLYPRNSQIAFEAQSE